ncbi:tubulointerstitial nephritis antigen-like [Mustelus asterias]
MDMKTILSVAWLLFLSPGLGAALSRSRRELSPGLHRSGIRDPGGVYCRRLASCCPGRDDVCAVPYIDTICYCDLFCNRTVSDCCPDFWLYCLGTQPPTLGCTKNGLQYPSGVTYRENCNLCFDSAVFNERRRNVESQQLSHGAKPRSNGQKALCSQDDISAPENDSIIHQCWKNVYE